MYAGVGPGRDVDVAEAGRRANWRRVYSPVPWARGGLATFIAAPGHDAPRPLPLAARVPPALSSGQR
jgi:hypothetical protein